MDVNEPLSSVVLKPQLALKMHHQWLEGGGHAVQAQDLYRASAQEQQHPCAHGDIPHPQLL